MIKPLHLYRHHFCALLFAACDFFIAALVPTLLLLLNVNFINIQNIFSYAMIFSVGVIYFRIEGQYTRRIPFWNDLLRTLRCILFMAAIHSLVIAFAWSYSGIFWLATWILLIILLPTCRNLMRKFLIHTGLWKRQAIIVGFGDTAVQAAVALTDEPLMGYELSAFIYFDDHDKNSNVPYIKIRSRKIPVIRTSPENFKQLLSTLNMPHIIIAMNGSESSTIKNMIEDLMMTYRDLNIIPSLPGLALFGTEANHFFSHDVLTLRMRNNLNYRPFLFIKRIFDVLIASCIFISVSPVMLWVALKIWQEDGGPVIFHQERMGLGGKKFRFYKFRSMVKNADSILKEWKDNNDDWWVKYKDNNFKLDNDPRILKIGRWIRSSSVDELPQLWNIIRGDMSLVGPRPLLPRELDDYGDSFHRYYSKALPGLTGLWQVSGRSETQFSDRIWLDAWYVRNWNLWYDIAILCKTFSVVFLKKGAM